jgi:CBS domain-containing membrane protein
MPNTNLASAAVRWLLSFAPHPVTVKWPERFRSCVGALFGIAFTGVSMHFLIGADAAMPLLVAPMGASAVLLFGVPASPLAQPWSIIGGNLVSAVVGVTCASWIANPVAAATLAVSLAMCAMFALRCVHPPSGAVALTAVLGGPAIHAMGYRFVLEPIAIQSTALLCAALAFHALTGHRYPHVAAQNRQQGAAPTSGFIRADLDAVLAKRSEWLDIDADDLEALLRETQMQGYARALDQLTCATIMSRPTAASTEAANAGPRAASVNTPIADLVPLFANHGHHHIPVLDAERRLVGMVTPSDLIAGLHRHVQRSRFRAA